MPDDIITRLRSGGPVDDELREDASNEIVRLRNLVASKPWSEVIEANDKLLDLCESIVETVEQIQAEIEKEKANAEAKIEE